MLAILYLTGELELDISYFEHKKFPCISILTFLYYALRIFGAIILGLKYVL